MELISIKHLEELLMTVDYDTDFIFELVEDFERNTPDTLKNLKQSILDKDFAKIEFFGHKLKGSAGNLGLKKIVSLSQSIENIGHHSSNYLEAQELWQELEQCYEKSLTEVKTWLESHKQR